MNTARLSDRARSQRNHEPIPQPTKQMNPAIIPPKLEERLKEMERGSIGMQEEARRLRQHLLTCPKCIEEMTNDSTNTPNTQEDDK